MTNYRQVVTAEPSVVAFLKKHEQRLDTAIPPVALFVAERDDAVVGCILVWTQPVLNIAVILGEAAGAMTLTKLAETFEAWAREKGATRYAFAVHHGDINYRRIVEHRGAKPEGRNGALVIYVQPLDKTEARSTPDPDGIRPWRPKDMPVLKKLMGAYLTEHYRLGGDFKATKHNIETFVQMGMTAADAGDPALVTVQDGKIIAFVLWMGMPNTANLDLRERICVGTGTYVLPEFRQKGISKALRARALEVAQEQGYTRVDGFALDERGFKAGASVGGKSAGLLVRLRVPAAAPERKVA